MLNVTYQVDDDGIAIATLDMPGRPFNVFSDDMIDELERLLDDVTAQPPRGLIIASGKDAFMAGADLTMVRGFTTLRFRATPAEVRATCSRLSRLMRRLECLPVPTVAAINGLALGGGLELAMACHRRVAIDSTQPCLGLPEVLLGLLPAAGGTQRLPRLIGLADGARMLLDGRPIAPTAALALGLVDALAAPAALLALARQQFAGMTAGARWDKVGWQAPQSDLAMLDGPDANSRLLAHAGIHRHTAHRYPALASICQCLIGGYRLPIDAALELEADAFLPLMLDPVAGNMVRTSFLSKTAAPKRAAQRLGTADAPVRRIAVAGLEPMPMRLARSFSIVGANDAPELSVQRTASVSQYLLTMSIRAEPGPVTVSDAVELRLAGDFEDAEAIEIAAAAGPTGALALSLVNRLKCVPIAVSASVPGPTARLLQAAAEWLSAHPEASCGGMANAVDLGALLRRLGAVMPEQSGTTDQDHANGIALLTCISQAAAACMADRAVETAADMDVLGVFALGYPAWTGGPLSFLDMWRRGEIAGNPADPAATVWYPG